MIVLLPNCTLFLTAPMGAPKWQHHHAAASERLCRKFVETWGSAATKGIDAAKQVGTPAHLCMVDALPVRTPCVHTLDCLLDVQLHQLRFACVDNYCTVLFVQELKMMVADDAVFKADGVVYTSDTKGEMCAAVTHV